MFAHRSYATFSDLIYDLTGTWIPLPFYSFGFFVGLSLFIGGIFIYLELKRRADQGLFKSFVYKKAKKKGEPSVYAYPHQVIGEMTLVAGISGFVGAKLFYFFEDYNNFQNFLQSPVDGLFSGLTVYGGLITGGLAIWYYARKRKISFIHLADSSAPGLILGYGIGRIGCHVSGDGDWGIVNNTEKPQFLSVLPDWLWAHDYPHNIINAGIPIPGCVEAHCFVLSQPVFPTPVYEFFAATFLFGVLWTFRNNISIPGMMFSIYLILQGLERFFIEKIRVNPVHTVAGIEFSQAELISSIIILAGISGCIFFYRKQKLLQLK